MPIIKSAKKRVRVARQAAIRNSKIKRSLRSNLKLFSRQTTQKNHASAQSSIDKALKKGVIHKNKAARLKKRAAAQAKAAGVKPTKTSSKTTAKPKSAKKAAAKKPASR